MKKTIAIATMAAVALTAVGTEASAATVKLVNNKLVNAKTGKVVSGYKVYKQKLYKNGVLAKGKVVRGTGKNMKLYTNGILKNGWVTTSNEKYLFINGVIAKGSITRGYNSSTIRIYKDGVLKTTYTLSKNEKNIYKNGKLIKGYTIFEIPKWIDQSGTLKLFKDGKLVTSGTKVYVYDGVMPTTFDVKKGDKLLFKNGKLQKGVVKHDGMIYDNGFSKRTWTVLYDGKYYFNQQLANGDINGERYKDGELLGYVSDFEFKDKAEAVKALRDQLVANPALSAEKIPQILQDIDTLASYYTVFFDQDWSYRFALGDVLKEIAALANDATLTERVDNYMSGLHGSQGLGYKNGALLEGVHDGILYAEGRSRGPIGSVYVREHEQAVTDALYSETAPVETNKAVIEDHLTLVIDALEKSIIHAASGEHADNYTNYEVDVNDVNRAVLFAQQFMKDVDETVDVSALTADLEKIKTLQATYKTLRP